MFHIHCKARESAHPVASTAEAECISEQLDSVISGGDQESSPGAARVALPS